MKNRKNPRNKIYEIRTYRAVKWCFTRSPILRSYIFVDSDQRYIYDGEIERKFYVCTYMRKLSVGVIVLTIWFKRTIFFLYFSLYSGLSLEILMFFIFCRNVLNACDSPASMSEVHGGGWKWFGQVHEPWNSMEPTMTNPRNEAHSLDRASHMHSDLYDKKWKISKCQEIVPNKVENREKKMLLLNQMVKTITPTDNFLM